MANENYETNEDGTLKLDDAGNPIPKALAVPAPQDNVPAWLVEVNRANNERDRALAELSGMRAAANQAPAPKLEPLAPGSLYDNPQQFEDRIVARLNAQIAPLLGFAEQVQKDTAYRSLKANAARMIPV